MHRTLAWAFILLCAVAVPACGGDDDLDITDPTPIDPVIVEFSGTLTVNGAQIHPFATDGGTVVATLISLAPDPLINIGLSLGTWNGAACQIIIANTTAIQGTNVIGTASITGNLCVYIQDVGNLTEPASYVVRVVHP